MESRKPDVFISYARENFGDAEKLCKDLESEGISVWFDDRSLNVGERWKMVIPEAINNVMFFIALISSESTTKINGFVQKEIDIALDVKNKKPLNDFFIFPVRLDDSKIPDKISSMHGIDIFPVFNYHQKLQSIVKNIRKYKDEKNLEIIGFDLGHGESAIAITNLSSSSEPQVAEIHGKRSIITAVTLSNTGDIVIGEDAYIENNGIDNLYIHFKTPDFKKSKTKSLKLFVKECLNILKKEGKAKLDTNTHFFVGHPSGWNKETLIKEYEEILQDAGMTNVKVRPESRAAFLEAKETGRLQKSLTKSPDNLLNNLLIIDIGSSTTDFTIIKNSEELPLDLGYNNLGGSLIDELIFNKTLEGMSPEDREEFNRLFQSNLRSKLQCFLTCRRAKEEYFSRESDNNTPIEKEKKINKPNGGKLYFEVSINKKDMEEILSNPLISPIDQLKGKTWKQAFTDALQECKKEIESPEIIFMTGGGSHMSFTREICQEEFPQSEVIRGLEPELSVAKGLAILGRVDFKIDLFRKEVKEFIDEPEKLDSIIKEAIQKFSNNSAKSLTEKTLKILKSCIEKWRDGEIQTIAAIEEKIKIEIKNDLDKENNFSEIETQKLIEHLGKEIQKSTDDLCDRYNIPKSIFDISINPNNKDVNFYSEINSLLIEKISKKLYATLPVLISTLFLFISIFIIFIAIDSVSIAPIVVEAFVVAGIVVSRDQVFSYFKDKYDNIKDIFEKLLRTTPIPIKLRNFFLNDEQITNLISEKRNDVENDINEQLNSELLQKNIYSGIKNYVNKRLNEQADIASFLIKQAETR
ncbi:hypothetical protein NIES2130_04430 [Scytonema sp. HK-05]|nr:hypothetical protein NIES2130_04430 [Scytonema sp. HK-05]